MTSQKHIPASIDDVTAAWVSDVTGFDVQACRAEQIGAGIGVSSALYRVSLEGTNCPATVVVKLPALDEAAVFTSTILRMYIREVGFFNELAGESPVRVPLPYYAAVDPETSHFVAVMEDMGDMRIVDQVLGMNLADAERAVDALASWHATWWNKGDDLAARGLTVSLTDPIYPAILPMVFDEGWQKVTASMEVAPAIHRVAEGFTAAVPGLLADLGRAPNTMIHGDYRGDNILFGPDDSVVMLDFQLIGTGRGAYDLAYMVTQSLEPDVAAVGERDLFHRWKAALLAAGVSAEDLIGSWDDYRKAALFCLVYPIVASRGMDLDDERQRDLVEVMNARFARAVEDLGLAEVLADY
ncbi:MAG TPA: phosphotransferase [Acidimicrobiales bacterium]|nr:phosphotransferase [Acidimicrobiales bacterium]